MWVLGLGFSYRVVGLAAWVRGGGKKRGGRKGGRGREFQTSILKPWVTVCLICFVTNIHPQSLEPQPHKNGASARKELSSADQGFFRLTTLSVQVWTGQSCTLNPQFGAAVSVDQPKSRAFSALGSRVYGCFENAQPSIYTSNPKVWVRQGRG